MPLSPIFAHDALRHRLAGALTRGTMPGSLLLHGRRGTGKQRLALWLGQTLLCSGAPQPCGACQGCRYATELTHPDLYWFFPVPRADISDSSPEEALAFMRGAMRDRALDGGLWGPSSGSEGLFVEMIRALVRAAASSPAMGRRKVMILGDADRMIAQEGSDQAANALLKLLEEPLPDTTLILTTSEPGALLPTIRSRVVAVRVAPLTPDELREWAGSDAVHARLGPVGNALLERASGAPGALLSGTAHESADAHAQLWLKALRGDAADRFIAVLSEKPAGARGGFADALDALEGVLHARLRPSVESGADATALAKAQDAVDAARARTGHNVNPALITAQLLRELRTLGING
ncbi:MAG: AAA family ATPase [Gemmatimonadaceae bacterium]|nr:AAA family ATPase [Gemmatimonadaceae bacterium]